jgi:hypothetical protein
LRASKISQSATSNAVVSPKDQQQQAELEIAPSQPSSATLSADLRNGVLDVPPALFEVSASSAV